MSSSAASFVIYSFLPPAIFGNEFGFLTAVYAVTASNTKDSQRGIRYILIALLRTVGSTLGNFIGSFIIDMTPWLSDRQLQNYAGNFIVSSGLSITAFIWAFVFVKEREREKANSPASPLASKTYRTNLDTKSVSGINLRDSSAWSTFKEIIDLGNFKNTWHILIKQRDGNVRLRMYLMILVVNLSLLPIFGKSAVIFSLAQKLYKWNSVTFSNWASMSGVIHIIATMVVVPIILKVIKPNDCQTAMIGVITGILADVFVGSIITPSGFYLHAVISSLMSISDTGGRAYLSKLLPEEEVSAMFAMTLVIEAVLKSVAAYSFAFILRMTISIYPTFVFHFMALLLIIALVILVFVDLSTPCNLNPCDEKQNANK